MAEIQEEVLDCCGLWGIYGLSAGFQVALNGVLDAIEMPKCCVAEDCDDEECESEAGSGPGICIATTNEDQDNSETAQQLRNQGFHAVLNTLNPNSGNRITLWVRDLTEGKTPTSLIIPTDTTPYAELRTAVQAYVTSNPNPRTNSAQRLVSRYKELFS